jgi:hypothetical protein
MNACKPDPANPMLCLTHKDDRGRGKPLLCASGRAAIANAAMQRKYSKKQRKSWARKGGQLGGRPKEAAAD